MAPKALSIVFLVKQKRRKGKPIRRCILFINRDFPGITATAPRALSGAQRSL
ncbi:hypothetical protein AB395_00001772 [Sinorhizobium fredii CCBAU 45436]|nr:hypothetical protein AB395_00001772 [Sinorhizobium fredii CCBAU 45436]